MATLYVENVPAEIYEALRKRAKSQRRSIAAEVIQLLQTYVPTEKEIKRRKEIWKRLQSLQFTKGPADGTFPSSEEMIREDRER